MNNDSGICARETEKPAAGLGAILLRNLVILLVFLSAWHASAIFEVRPQVSALYFACGVTFSVAVLYGWRYLASVYLATVIAYLQSKSFPDLPTLELWLAPLRQTLIYGLAGLSIRHIWKSDAFRFSVPVALRFLITAFTASLLSASVAIHMAPFNTLPPDKTADVFFSFWGGDFAGLMVSVPVLLMLHKVVKLAKQSSNTGWSTIFAGQINLRDTLMLSAFGIIITLLAILIPPLFDSEVRVDVLILLPVLLAGLWRGAFVAFLVAMQVSLLQVFVRPYLGIPAGLTIDLQLLIAMNAAVALLAGAAHDDKHFEWERANFDSLTGLANHSYFVDRLEHEINRVSRNHKVFALFYLDLDGFKTINDTLGHAAGDELLRKIAKRLLQSVRSTDTVARLGGDEFAIILSETGSHKDVERLAQTLLESIVRPVHLDQHSVHVTASIGIAYCPEHGTSAKELMHTADMAMYQSKAKGKNRFATSATV